MLKSGWIDYLSFFFFFSFLSPLRSFGSDNLKQIENIIRSRLQMANFRMQTTDWFARLVGRSDRLSRACRLVGGYATSRSA